MADFARAEFALGAVDRNGDTKRDLLLAAYEQDGKYPQELLDAPDFPSLGKYIWDWFQEDLSPRRQVIQGEPQPLTWQDLEAWSRMQRGLVLDRWEQRALFRLDDVFVDTVLRTARNMPTESPV